MKIGELILAAQELLGRIHEDTQSSEERELLRVAFDVLGFTWSAGHLREFEDYRGRLESDAPAPVVAAFSSREEADAWLKDNPRPPHMAYVLIADEYHVVADFRDGNRRALLPHPTLEFHLEELARDGLPPPVATFNTREEALDWFDNLAERPPQAVIQIGGEHHLAVFHRNIGHRSIYPFSLVQRLKKGEGTAGQEGSS